MCGLYRWLISICRSTSAARLMEQKLSYWWGPEGTPEGCIESLILGRDDNWMVGAAVGRQVGVCPKVLYVKLEEDITLYSKCAIHCGIL